MPQLQLGIALLYAVSSGYGFDSGFGVEARIESTYLEVQARATSEKKHDADSGYTWGGMALLMYPDSDLRCFAGVSVYGYESVMSDSTWRKNAYSPVVGVDYQFTRARLRVQYSFENEYDQSLTSVSYEYAMTPRWWFGGEVGMESGSAVADLRLTFRP